MRAASAAVANILIFVNIFISVKAFRSLPLTRALSSAQLCAKKKSGEPKRGFGRTKYDEEKDMLKAESSSSLESDEMSPGATMASVKQGGVVDDALSNSVTPEDVFKKYGIKNGEEAAAKKQKSKSSSVSNDGGDRPFGEGIIAKVPVKLQMQIDSFLLTATFASLGFIILCGISISFDAFKVVFPDVKVSENIDQLISNVLTPAFTPALFLFFFFSVTFGLFKYAQVSSSQTVYRE